MRVTRFGENDLSQYRAFGWVLIALEPLGVTSAIVVISHLQHGSLFDQIAAVSAVIIGVMFVIQIIEDWKVIVQRYR
jgi:hypothetical protein